MMLREFLAEQNNSYPSLPQPGALQHTGIRKTAGQFSSDHYCDTSVNLQLINGVLYPSHFVKNIYI